MKLRLATYNIHKGVTGLTRRVRIHEVRAALHALDADVVFLQEVQDRNRALERLSRRHPGGSQAAFLADTHYPHYAYGANARYRHGDHGNAILSRLPLSGSDNIDVSDHRFEQRGLLHATAVLPDGSPLHLLCVHFGLFAGGRERQAQALIERINAVVPAGEPLVIAGDFNDWRGRLHAPLVHALGVTEAFAHGCPHSAPAATFPSRLPWLPPDRIYLRGVRIRRAEVPGGRQWPSCSDHMPLVAEIEVIR